MPLIVIGAHRSCILNGQTKVVAYITAKFTVVSDIVTWYGARDQGGQAEDVFRSRILKFGGEVEHVEKVGFGLEVEMLSFCQTIGNCSVKHCNCISGKSRCKQWTLIQSINQSLITKGPDGHLQCYVDNR